MANDFYDVLRDMYRAEGGGRSRDPARSFLWWVVKTILFLALGVVVGGLTIVSCVGAYAGIPSLTSLFGIVVLILFVVSPFMWQGKR